MSDLTDSSTIHLSHVVSDAELQVNVYGYKLDYTAGKKIVATLKARTDVHQVRLSNDGWLIVRYTFSGLAGDKRQQAINKLIKVVQTEIFRKCTTSTTVKQSELVS